MGRICKGVELARGGSITNRATLSTVIDSPCEFNLVIFRSLGFPSWPICFQTRGKSKEFDSSPAGQLY